MTKLINVSYRCCLTASTPTPQCHVPEESQAVLLTMDVRSFRLQTTGPKTANNLMSLMSCSYTQGCCTVFKNHQLQHILQLLTKFDNSRQFHPESNSFNPDSIPPKLSRWQVVAESELIAPVVPTRRANVGPPLHAGTELDQYNCFYHCFTKCMSCYASMNLPYTCLYKGHVIHALEEIPV